MSFYLAWLAIQQRSAAFKFEAESHEKAAEMRLQQYHNTECGNMSLKHGSKRLVNVCLDDEQVYQTITVEVIETVQFVAVKGA